MDKRWQLALSELIFIESLDFKLIYKVVIQIGWSSLEESLSGGHDVTDEDLSLWLLDHGRCCHFLLVVNVAQYYVEEHLYEAHKHELVVEREEPEGDVIGRIPDNLVGLKGGPPSLIGVFKALARAVSVEEA